MAGNVAWDVTPPRAGAGPPAGPHGGLHGADAWHWHRRGACTDARHVCPWCAPRDDGPPSTRRRDAWLEALIARIKAARWMAPPGERAGAMWPLGAWQWRAAAAGDWPERHGHGAWHARVRAASLPTL